MGEITNASRGCIRRSAVGAAAGDVQILSRGFRAKYLVNPSFHGDETLLRFALYLIANAHNRSRAKKNRTAFEPEPTRTRGTHSGFCRLRLCRSQFLSIWARSRLFFRNRTTRETPMMLTVRTQYGVQTAHKRPNYVRKLPPGNEFDGKRGTPSPLLPTTACAPVKL